jgi:gluconolactonase
VRKVSGGFQFTEGPACESAGNVFFSDQPNDRIMKWSVNATLETFMQPSGRSNGMCFDDEDNLWTCSNEKNELWRIDPDGNHMVVVRELGSDGMTIDDQGNIYHTLPGTKLPWLIPTAAQSRKLTCPNRAGLAMSASAEPIDTHYSSPPARISGDLKWR